MDSMEGPNWEVKKHSHKYGTKCSSKSKKMDAPSTSLSNGDGARAKSHRHEKKSHKQQDLMVPRTEPSVLPSLAPQKMQDPSVLGKITLLAPARKERVPLTLVRFGTITTLQDVFALLDPESPHPSCPSTSREIISQLQDMPLVQEPPPSSNTLHPSSSYDGTTIGTGVHLLLF